MRNKVKKFKKKILVTKKKGRYNSFYKKTNYRDYLKQISNFYFWLKRIIFDFLTEIYILIFLEQINI
jgi:hypothetical protein